MQACTVCQGTIDTSKSNLHRKSEEAAFFSFSAHIVGETGIMRNYVIFPTSIEK